MSEASSGGSPGPSTDKDNKPVVDPTSNVRELVEAGKERADDLRRMSEAALELDGRWRDKMDELRAAHAREMALKESQRIDANRAADATNVQRAADVQSGVAAALEQKVTQTAAAFESRLTATIEPIQRRIDDLTRAQYEAQGQKTQVVETRDQGSDNRSQTTLVLGLVLGLVTILMAIVTVYALTQGAPA